QGGDAAGHQRPDRQAAEAQTDLFADFNGIPPEADKTEFYQHDANWTNRMILGDSLQVMASLAEREGLRGKVQCIYFDPPYGIKFNSNFQWSTTSRDVKDGNADHITREPEQVKAFRDTWRDGIHSYLTYLRDRLTVARDLLTESGSIFVQIGDENVHRVRALMDEVFGENNFVAVIAYAKTTGFSGATLSSVTDYIIWYGKDVSKLKYRALFSLKQAGDEGASKYREAATIAALKNSANELTRLATSDQLTSQGASMNSEQEFNFKHKQWKQSAGLHWKTTVDGMARVAKTGRIIEEGNSIRYVRFMDDFSIFPQTNVWLDIGGVQSRTDPKIYVVQTATEAIKRCVLMATDPGDLVLDPTCGSGTTAYVAEQWGRRWITIDTSRVALALARARIMGARYPYYLLADSRDGQIKEAESSRKEPS
ncbi:site-specific DNA-methyltransferase, partial [bacterium]|nr:site-specific DNA-methyltransferase [bacterium]